MKKSVLIMIFVLLVFTEITLSLPGLKQKRPRPNQYGQVILNNLSENEGIAPVVFDHWFHRLQYTCRVCHIDIGFSMETGASGVTASDNMDGYYCGTCHNGKDAFPSCKKDVFPEIAAECQRCHSLNQDVKRKYDFHTVTKDLPRGRFGNGIDWEKAELANTIKLQDAIEGVSIKDTFQFVSEDFKVSAKLEGFPDIIFSHEKHTVWSGCGGCHPDIFTVKKGTTLFTMKEIFDGKYCGTCHGSVAFPLIDCQRCHTTPVQ